MPPESIGELYIGGAGLARGYLNQSELNDDRFIDNPFGDGRLYRTGDLVRRLPNGELLFVGRSDDQVQLRGFRIELGEVQQQLAALPDIAAAAVIMREDAPGDPRLTGYVTLADKSLNESDQEEIITGWRRELQSRLPDYMMPSAFVILDEFPLTANGKLDRRALPVPGYASHGKYVAPATETEMALAGIWANLLKVDANDISTSANLFELGGHSLLLMRLIAEIRNKFTVEVSIKEVIEHPQLNDLAQRIFETSLKSVLTIKPDYEMGTDEMEITI